MRCLFSHLIAFCLHVSLLGPVVDVEYCCRGRNLTHFCSSDFKKTACYVTKIVNSSLRCCKLTITQEKRISSILQFLFPSFSSSSEVLLLLTFKETVDKLIRYRLHLACFLSEKAKEDNDVSQESFKDEADHCQAPEL